MRRSVVAGEDLTPGDVLTVENVAFKRPASGFLGKDLHKLLGRRVSRKVPKDQIITEDLLQ